MPVANPPNVVSAVPNKLDTTNKLDTPNKLDTLNIVDNVGFCCIDHPNKPSNPLEMAKIGNKELRECLSISGYDIEEYKDE